MRNKVMKIIDNIWWMFVLQGVFTVVFGVVALFWPSATFVTLVYLFAAYILVLGVVLCMRGIFRSKRQTSWWFTTLIGIFGIGFGVYLIAYPQVAISTFVGILGIVLLIRGIFDLFLAAYVIKQDSKALWIISGSAGIFAAVVLWRYPVETGVAFVWVLGLYALIAGTISLVYAYRARHFLDNLKIELKLKK